MFEIILALLSLLLIIAAVVIYRKQPAKNSIHIDPEKLALNLLRIKHDRGIKASFETALVHQTLILDESARKMLVVNNNSFLSEVYPLDAITSLKVVNTKQAILPARGERRSTIITKLISLEMSFDNPERKVTMSVFDHNLHDVSQIQVMEKHAWYLHEQITKAKIHELLSA
jgi:hypothetical protein